MKFYKNPETKEIRIVREVDENHFIVVKLINQGTYTLKAWRGSLSNTARHWNTKEFEPTPEERRLLRKAYVAVLNKMIPVICKGGIK